MCDFAFVIESIEKLLQFNEKALAADQIASLIGNSDGQAFSDVNTQYSINIIQVLNREIDSIIARRKKDEERLGLQCQSYTMYALLDLSFLFTHVGLEQPWIASKSLVQSSPYEMSQAVKNVRDENFGASEQLPI